jgi:hypothetical protein
VSYHLTTKEGGACIPTEDEKAIDKDVVRERVYCSRNKIWVLGRMLPKRIEERNTKVTSNFMGGTVIHNRPNVPPSPSAISLADISDTLINFGLLLY